MDTTDPKAIVESVKTGDNGGLIKSVTDLKIEKLEARLNDLENINAELRKANAELYAIASSKEVPGKNGGGTTDRSGSELTSAQVMKNESAEQERAVRENAMLQSVLADMGYRRVESQSNVTTATSKVEDGM